MGRAKKKPEYDQNRIMEQFQNCIVEAYTSGIADGTGISLRQVSEEFCITLMKTRKILITAGIYHTENSEQINSMRKRGMNIPEIMKATGFAKLLDYHWELSKKVDAGSSNTLIEQIFSSIEEMIDGRLVCGAGGGGFLQVILKKGITREDVEKRLNEVFMDSLVGVADCKLVW